MEDYYVDISKRKDILVDIKRSKHKPTPKTQRLNAVRADTERCLGHPFKKRLASVQRTKEPQRKAN